MTSKAWTLPDALNLPRIIIPAGPPHPARAPPPVKGNPTLVKALARTHRRKKLLNTSGSGRLPTVRSKASAMPKRKFDVRPMSALFGTNHFEPNNALRDRSEQSRLGCI